MAKRAVWISKGHFEDPDEPGCGWASEGRNAKPFQVPPPDALLIVYDQDKLPVELWRVGKVTHISPEYEAGWTTFAETTMDDLVTTSSTSGIQGIDFQDRAIMVIPPNSGWMGDPRQLSEAQVEELFDYLGWPQDLRR